MTDSAPASARPTDQHALATPRADVYAECTTFKACPTKMWWNGQNATDAHGNTRISTIAAAGGSPVPHQHHVAEDIDTFATTGLRCAVSRLYQSEIPRHGMSVCCHLRVGDRGRNWLNHVQRLEVCRRTPTPSLNSTNSGSMAMSPLRQGDRWGRRQQARVTTPAGDSFERSPGSDGNESSSLRC